MLTREHRHWIAFQFNVKAGQSKLAAWINAHREIREQDRYTKRR